VALAMRGSIATSISSEEKKNILQNDFNIAMTEEIEKEVNGMCNLSDGLVESGRQEGIQQGEDNLAKLFEKLFELGRTDDAKRVSKDKEYRKLLMKELKIV
jgi:hypothetical protein